MSIDIQARDFYLSDSILREVEKRIHEALGKRYDSIQHISVRLGDINGPRGGKDKSCRIRISIPGHKDVFIEDIESDLYAAIYHAADRANRTLSRTFSRDRQRGLREANRTSRDRNHPLPDTSHTGWGGEAA